MTPVWIIEQQWRALDPPAEIRKLGELPRSAEKLLEASRVLLVKSAKRYQPTKLTFCNIYMADVLQILNARIDHLWDPDGDRGPLPAHETTANEIVLNLRASKYPGWEALGVLASGQLSAANYAALGLPAIAIWKNPSGASGHVMLVVPAPAGKSGLYLTGAGRFCHEQCTLAEGFGGYAPQVEFFGFRDGVPVAAR